MADYDVMVVGAGNAALAAAVSAREQGAGRVVVLEKAPRELRGGNTHYSGGLLRFAYDRAEDLLPLVPDAEQRGAGLPRRRRAVSRRSASATTSTAVTEGRSDPELSRDPDRALLRHGPLDGPAGDRDGARGVAQRRARRATRSSGRRAR